MGEERDRAVEAAMRAEAMKNDPQQFPAASREMDERMIEYIPSDN